jgi:FkbM family methyltransferase
MKKIIRHALNSVGLDVGRYRKKADPLSFLHSHNINTVFDVGANTGQFASEIRAVLQSAQIYSFEPVKKVYAELQHNMQSDMRWKGFNVALGEKKGSARITVSPYSPSSSLMPKSELLNQTFPHTRGGTEETITVETLDEVAQSLPLTQNILVKLDVQGFEDKVIKGGNAVLSKTKVVITEASFFPIYEGQPLFDDIYTLLKSLGFKYHGGLHSKPHPKTGEILFEDSIFIKE